VQTESLSVDESGSRASNNSADRDDDCANDQCKESHSELADLVRGNRGGLLRLLRGLLILLLSIRERALGFFARHSRAFHEQIRRLLAIGRSGTTLLKDATQQRLYFLGLSQHIHLLCRQRVFHSHCIACCLILSHEKSLWDRSPRLQPAAL
jgi:hypothetical protein